jgi:hypothetical protein
MLMIAPDLCQDCTFSQICMPMEKMSRNSDGLCDDFTPLGTEDVGADSNEIQPPFILGQK